MKRITLAMPGLLFALASYGASGATAGSPLAIVASVRGPVDVTAATGGSASRAGFGRALGRGDRLNVGAHGHVTIVFNDGNVIELGEKSTLTIGGRAATAPRAAGAAPLGGEIVASVNRFVAGGSRESGLVGLTPLRAGGEPAALLVTPRRSNLLDDRPALAWRRVDEAVRYHVTVSTESGELWSRDVSDTAMTYPADAPPLPRGRDAEWEVRALSDRDEIRRESAVVHVVPVDVAMAARDAVARIREVTGDANPAARFLAGSYDFGQGLYEDSRAEFERLAELAPDSPGPHEALGNVYRAQGLMERAAEEYRKALELGREP